MIKIVLILISIILLICIYLYLDSCKYEFDFEQDEHGIWKQVPVFHPCGEPIDEEWIKEWHRKEKLYKAQWKK